MTVRRARQSHAAGWRGLQLVADIEAAHADSRRTASPFLVPSRNSFTPETAAYAGGRSVWWPGAADALKARVGNGSESR